MKRYHQELARTQKEHQLHLRMVHGWPLEPVQCICDHQAGRFRKKKAMAACSQHCRLCNSHRWYPSTQELRLQERTKFDLREVPDWKELVQE